MPRRPGLLGVLLALGACTADPAPTAPAADAGTDLGTWVPPDAGPPPRWRPDVGAFDPPRAGGGTRWLRTVIHAHTVFSHDACDGDPRPDGGINAPCLQHFREAVCEDHVDVVFLTEHRDSMADMPFDALLNVRDGDEPVTREGRVIGVRRRCPDGHVVALYPGAENALMPIGLLRHPDPVEGSVGQAYSADDAAGVARFRAAGALVAVAHTEQRSLAHLLELGPDMIEVYNLHANVGPDIRVNHLGLDAAGYLPDLLRFSRDRTLATDLSFLSFFGENDNALRKWAALSRRRHVTAIAGTDVHENTFRSPMPDGERGDSYRRLLRWFANIVRVEGEATREAVLDALRAGRSYVAFEALGTPRGFAFEAERGDARHGMGERVPRDGATLVVRRPEVADLAPGAPAPEVTLRLLRATDDGWQEVARGTDAALRWPATEPGAYRAEVRMVPRHAAAFLPGMERLASDRPWIYSNTIDLE